MKKIIILITFFTLLLADITKAQYGRGDSWLENPLGFEPVKLHTALGFIIPAVAVGTCLLLTKKDRSLTSRLSVYNESGFSWGYKYPHTFLSQNNTGINFQLRKWMSIGTEIDLFFPPLSCFH